MEPVETFEENYFEVKRHHEQADEQRAQNGGSLQDLGSELPPTSAARGEEPCSHSFHIVCLHNCLTRKGEERYKEFFRATDPARRERLESRIDFLLSYFNGGSPI
jgi:hypothetical protein